MAVYSAESSRLWLQPLSIDDHLQDYFEIMSSPGSMLWSRGLPHKSIEETRALMQESLPTPEKPWNKRWAIVLKPSPSDSPNSHSKSKSTSKPDPESNPENPEADADSDSKAETKTKTEAEAEAANKPKMIGIIGTPRKGEVAYKISPAFWGKGYMSEAMSLFLAMFWSDEANNTFIRLTAGADPENHGSVRVLEKAGFRKGELVKGFHVRAVNIDSESCSGKGDKRSDMQFFYLERPVVVG